MDETVVVSTVNIRGTSLVAGLVPSGQLALLKAPSPYAVTPPRIATRFLRCLPWDIFATHPLLRLGNIPTESGADHLLWASRGGDRGIYSLPALVLGSPKFPRVT